MVHRHRRLFASLGSWALVSSLGLELVGCSAKAGQARCDPAVEDCGAGGSDNTGAAGQGGSAGSATTATSGTGGSTTGGAGQTGAGGSGGSPADAGRNFKSRVIVYLPTWAGSLRTWTIDMPWLRVSHVNIAFAAPSGTTLTLGAQDQYLAGFITAAHNTGAKVSVSLGGAGAGSAAIAAQYTPANVDAFVTNIANYLDAQNLDGVDVDVEGGTVNSNYGPFIDKLVAKVRPKGKLVTAALAQWFAGNLQPNTYTQFDFVNIMSYDACGSNPCEHSTYDAAVRDLEFFKSKGVTADKLVLGVPFYCHCWGAGCGGTTNHIQVPYAQVLVKFPGGMDYIQSAGTTYSCNGPATMQRKTMLSRSYGGMMAWEITQDAGGNQALLKVIADNSL